MKASVIVPVFNLEPFIGPCLESLVNQVVDFDYEIVVANDCSTDNSLDVINAYKQRYPELIKLIDQPVNRGLAVNMRCLLRAAKGQYVAYIDGDDLALSGKLQAQVDFLDNNPDCGMVYHESEVFQSDSGEVTSHYVQDYYNRNYIPEKADISHLIRYGSFFQASSLMIRNHEAITSTVDAGCKIILDQPFQILNAGYLQSKIGRLPQVLGRYRIHAASFGAKTLQDAKRREQVLMDQLQAISHGSIFGVAEELLSQGRAHYYMATAIFFLKLGDIQRFNEYITLSAETSWRFDTRHAFLFDNRSDHVACKKLFVSN